MLTNIQLKHRFMSTKQKKSDITQKIVIPLFIYIKTLLHKKFQFYF